MSFLLAKAVTTITVTCTPLGWQTTEESPSWTWQTGGGSFVFLSRRHAFRSRWQWNFNHKTCEKHLEEVQGDATRSLFLPSLFQDTWLPVHLLCIERNAPCQWDLTIDKARPPTSTAEWQGNDQTDLQCQATRHCHHQLQWATCETWHWGSGLHSEGEKALLVWTCGTLQWCSQDSLWPRLMENMGLGGPRWHGSSWQRDCRDWMLSVIEPHDRHTWRSGVRSAMHTASQLAGRGPTGVDVTRVPAP